MGFLKTRSIGNVRTLLNGRIVIGPDWPVMVMSMCFITVGSLLFICYVNTIDGARTAVGIFGVLSLVFTLLCGLRDPGLCPKELPPPIDAPAHEPIEVQLSYTNFDGTTGTAFVERKWCYSCNLYRPIRAVHCRFCDVCVCRRDHHCPWTGICIGAGNYRAYFALVWSAFALVLTAIIGGIMSLTKRTCAILDQQTAAKPSSGDPASALGKAITETWCLEAFLLAFCVLWVGLVGTLAVYHTYLVLNNKTSGDDAKRGDVSTNYYNRGSLVRNLRESFWPPVSVLYEGGPLAGHGDEWAITFANEEDEMSDAPQVVPNHIVAERSRRREGEGVLMSSVPTSARSRASDADVVLECGEGTAPARVV